MPEHIPKIAPAPAEPSWQLREWLGRPGVLRQAGRQVGPLDRY